MGGMEVASEGSVALAEPLRGEPPLAPLGGCSRFPTGVHTGACPGFLKGGVQYLLVP